MSVRYGVPVMYIKNQAGEWESLKTSANGVQAFKIDIDMYCFEVDVFKDFGDRIEFKVIFPDQSEVNGGYLYQSIKEPSEYWSRSNQVIFTYSGVTNKFKNDE